MQPFCFRGRGIVMVLLAVFLLAGGGAWWLCERSDAVAFLPARSGGEWIVAPSPPQIPIHPAFPIRAVFYGAFRLNSQPANARLSICAFKSAGVKVNGHEVDGLNCTGKNWKSPATAEITRWLQTGTNDITVCVTNTLGPPALWLRLQEEQVTLGSDGSWVVSLAGGRWEAARPARERPGIPSWSPIYESRRAPDSVGRVWPLLALFCAAAVALIWGVERWLRRPAGRPDGVTPPKLIYVLLTVIVAARAALFINNQPQLPHWMGFDGAAHERYIQYIQEKSVLPLPNEGWETYQPPLYYAGSALLLKAGGLKAGSAGGEILLHAVNGVAGLVHCWLALLCLGLLFPGNFSAQAVGLLVAAFLPPHLYLSQYVTNEPLAGMWVTLAFYFCLRLLQSDKDSLLLHLGLGLALGAAMLTKVSALLAVPCFLLAVGLRWFGQGQHSLRGWLRSVGVVMLGWVMVCGWYYGWVWAHFGRPIVGNWQGDIRAAWWQDYGYGTSSHYWSFGQCLLSPLFSGFHSFADGIYSTLWGDGLISGGGGLAFRPPWNYDLMNAEYWLAGAMTLLAGAGLLAALFNFVRHPTTAWLTTLGLAGMFGLGIIYMSLQVPYYSVGKAFFGFPALAPFSALIAAGWNWLAQRHHAGRGALRMLVLVWAMTAYGSFWIGQGNAETWRLRGFTQLQEQRSAEAIASFSHALQLNPDDAQSHAFMAAALVQQNRPAEAVRQYEEAMRLRPDYPDILNDLAAVLSTGGDKEAARAVTLARRACELTDYRQALLVSTLATAYAKAGQHEAAAVAAQRACDLAAQNGESALLQKNQELLKGERAQGK
ncbi:MAG: tetratricopeptide repeat protein [Verrucomicrobiota bacterium]